MDKRLLVVVLLVVIVFSYSDSHASTGYAVKGQILFAGEPPPIGAFKVGVCEINDALCVYSVMPPGPTDWPDADGNFEIVGVPPGEYGLVFDFNYYFQIMPWWPDESGEILFTITNSNIDLGNLHYDNWPCEILPRWDCGLLYMPIVIKEVE